MPATTATANNTSSTTTAHPTTTTTAHPTPTPTLSATNVKSGLRELLTPDNCCVLFIDHQPAMTFGVANIDRQTLLNNVVGLAKAARTFGVPVILTSVESGSFSGAIWPQLTSLFPAQPVIERSSMNSWEDAALLAAVQRTGRTKLVIAALWTEVCLAFPALCALSDGYDVYAVEDCSGGTSQVAHEAAISRIVQAGGVRTTWVSTMLEWQRDWARKEHYNDVMQIVIEVSHHTQHTERTQHRRAHSTGTDTARAHPLSSPHQHAGRLLSAHCHCYTPALIATHRRPLTHCTPSAPLLPVPCPVSHVVLCSTAACTVRLWSTATRWCTRRRPTRSGWRRRRRRAARTGTATASTEWSNMTGKGRNTGDRIIHMKCRKIVEPRKAE